MHCFNHAEKDAVGICRSCGRGVCLECCHNSGMTFLSCSANCAEKGQAMDEMTEKTEKFYRVGRYKTSKQKTIPTSAAIFLLMGFLLLIIPVLLGEKVVNSTTLPIVMVFFITGCFSWWRDYKRGINI